MQHGHLCGGGGVKIRIPLTVDVDVEAWSAEYGIEPAGVRQDVRAKLANDLYVALTESPLGYLYLDVKS
jgi:hypothetical protein